MHFKSIGIYIQIVFASILTAACTYKPKPNYFFGKTPNTIGLIIPSDFHPKNLDTLQQPFIDGASYPIYVFQKDSLCKLIISYYPKEDTLVQYQPDILGDLVSKITLPNPANTIWHRKENLIVNGLKVPYLAYEVHAHYFARANYNWKKHDYAIELTCPNNYRNLTSLLEEFQKIVESQQ